MNETEKTSIETELSLREKLLSFKKKQQELNRETWRRIGTYMGFCFVLLFCMAVVVFGGMEIHHALHESIGKEDSQQCIDLKCTITPLGAKEGTNESTTIPISTNNLGLILADSQKVVLFRPESTLCPHSWSPNIALIINGFLVLFGLGIMTFLSSRLLRERE